MTWTRKPSRPRALPILVTLSLLAVHSAAQVPAAANDASSAAISNPTSQSSISNTDPTTSTSATFATTTSASGPTNTLSTSSAFPTIGGVLPPPLIVPDTSGAPFMQKSNLPEGTVFICVGAALGFLGACVLAWRGLVAWSLHRSVRRAAETTYAPDNKSMFGPGGLASSSQGYKSTYSNNESALSLDHLSSAPTGYGGPSRGRNHSPSPAGQRGSTHDLSTTRRTSRQPPHGNRSSRAPPPDRSSLFFSPTAQNTTSSTTSVAALQHNAPGNRSSAHLPAGYYASTASAPAAGQPTTQFGGQRHSHAPPAPHSGDGSSAHPTPPDSPLIRPGSSHLLRPDSPSANSMTASVGRPTSGHMQVQARSQSRDRLSAAVRPEQRRSRLGPDGGAPRDRERQGGRERERTPSAYFDDLLENHGFGPGERFQ